jgi:hypothetical protein
MKHMKTTLTALLLTAIVFTACKKSDSTTPTPASLPAKPSISTALVTNITSNSAKCGGIISDSGTVYKCMGRGVIYSSVEPNPDLGTPTAVQTYDFSNTNSNFGNYPSSLTGLTPNTTYYVRAYMGYEIIATRVLSFLYGEVRSFKTAP